MNATVEFEFDGVRVRIIRVEERTTVVIGDYYLEMDAAAWMKMVDCIHDSIGFLGGKR